MAPANPVTRVSNGSGAVQINSVQTVAPGWCQIESEMALDLITIPALSALSPPSPPSLTHGSRVGSGSC